MKIKKYSRWVLLLFILLASVKAILFTGNLAVANYFLYSNNQEKAATFLYRIVCTKPVVYRSFHNAQKILVEDLILKKAIYAKYHENKNVFALFSANPNIKELTIERFKTLYRDNFYLQEMFPPIPPQSNWKNLDPVSLELLADKTMNPLTLSLWKKITATGDPGFMANLADYCRWQGNKELEEFLVKAVTPPIVANSFLNRYHGHPAANESFAQLLKSLKKTNKLTKPLASEHLTENRTAGEDFNDAGSFNKKWELSVMTGSKDLHAASFTMGVDGTDNNNCLRIMGFFNGSNDGKTKTTARGGAMRKKILPISRGYYLLSFDYLTATGWEKPSLYLWKGIWEIFLPPTGGEWKKAVCLLNNSMGTYSGIKPIFRMWGTGTVLIDNIYFAAITDPALNFNRTTQTFIAEGK